MEFLEIIFSRKVYLHYNQTLYLQGAIQADYEIKQSYLEPFSVSFNRHLMKFGISIGY